MYKKIRNEDSNPRLLTSKLSHKLSLGIFAITLSGCASVPPVEMSYYLPTTNVDITVIRTVACTSGKVPIPIIASSVIHDVKYVADMEATKRSLSIADLDGSGADMHLEMEFHDDGRLAGINSSNTGQGGKIVDAAISLAGAALGLKGVDGAGPRDYTLFCSRIKDLGGGKPVTVTYMASIDFKKNKNGEFLSVEQDIDAVSTSAYLHDRLGSALYPIKLRLGQQYVSTPAIAYNMTTAKRPETPDPVIWVVSPTIQNITVLADPGTPNSEDEIFGSSSETTARSRLPKEILWQGSVQIANAENAYPVPIPRSALFGSQSFSLTLNASGSLKKIRFEKKSGLSQGFDASNSIVGLLDGETPSEELDRLKTEANLILEQKRIVACRINSNDC